MSEHPVDILYEVGPCLVVAKPSGVLTQAPPGIDSLELRLKSFLKARDGKTGNIYLGVPHRLDRPVSGAMVFARHVRASRRISDQFATRTVKKVYWACVSGHVEPREGTWNDYVRKIPGQPQAEIVAADQADGREAVLHYRVIGETQFGSWLSIELETGRMHQIRVQAAARGHAVLGDAMYGSTVSFGEAFEDERLRAIALHARQLGLQHPMTQEAVDVTAPLPEAWAALQLPSLDASEE
ncbi:MAG: RluA family pseudouridine synthase [Planctomycetota bacterium]|nr:MAG: RluA family pseudouridine synthase [Planctomycetota bacterium]REK43095.1 MAG: RluA family pseudouridine synthase [Planctomycetota bacterium]